MYVGAGTCKLLKVQRKRRDKTNKIKHATWKTMCFSLLSTEAVRKISDLKLSEEFKKER